MSDKIVIDKRGLFGGTRIEIEGKEQIEKFERELEERDVSMSYLHFKMIKSAALSCFVVGGLLILWAVGSFIWSRF